MDRLDELAATALPLLRRVDDLIAIAGAPAGHHLWAELRRVRVLSTEAVHTVAGLRPEALTDAAPQLRRQARQYADIATALPGPDPWAGEAAEAYDAGRRRMVDHLSGDPESLAERLEASADLGDALVDWMRQARADVAVALADALASAEALLLCDVAAVPTTHRGEPPGTAEILAAAEIAARLLRVVADAYDVAEDLLDGSSDLATAELLPARHPSAWPGWH